MANLPESNTFDEGIYQIETSDPVMGGVNGVSNTPLKQLANRTRWLKTWLDDVISKYAPKISPALQGTPTAPTGAQGLSTQQLANTEFVQQELARYWPKAGIQSGTLGLPTGAGSSFFSPGNGDGASYQISNLRLNGWFGLGMYDHAGDIHGFYDFRVGKWDCKGGYFVNGVRTWDATNFDPASKQDALGFPAVQQGTGLGQSSNVVKIGWSAQQRLKATVDTVDVGNIVFDSQLSNYIPVSGRSDLTGGLAWGNVGISPGTGDGATYTTYNLALKSWFGIGFVDSMDGVCNTVLDTRSGNFSTKGFMSADGDITSGGNFWAKATDLYLTAFKRSVVASDGSSTFLRTGDSNGSLVFQNQVGSVLATMYSSGVVRYTNRVFGTSFFFTESSDDTGFEHPGDGLITQYNNSVLTWGHSQTGSTANVPVYVPTPATGDSSTRVASTAFVRNVLSSEFTSGPGWRRNYDGSIEQIGAVYVGDDGGSGRVGTWTYPIPFPNACLNVQVSVSDAAGAYHIVANVNTPSAQAVVWHMREVSSGAQNVTLHFRAIGY